MLFPSAETQVQQLWMVIVFSWSDENLRLGNVIWNNGELKNWFSWSAYVSMERLFFMKV